MTADSVSPSPPPSNLLSTMMASAVSGALVRVPLHPLDTCKARLQVRTGGRESLLQCLRSTWRAEGLRGLYAGFPITVLGSAPAASLYLTSYEVNKEWLSKLSVLQSAPVSLVHFSAGLLAEFVSCVLWVPIDVIKERLQTQSLVTDPSLRYTSTMHAIRSISHSEGLLGLYRGYGATVASFGPYSAFYLSGYEACKQWAAKALHTQTDALPFVAYLAAGGLAGGFAALVTNPLDMAKLRLQVQRRAATQSTSISHAVNPFNFGYRNLLHGLSEIVRHEGGKALFKGAAARIAFFAPSSALNIATFDTLRNLFNQRLRANDNGVAKT